MEEKKSNRGGARPNSGRKPGSSMTPISLKLQTELLEVFEGIKENDKAFNRNTYINDAIRERLKADGYM